MRSALAALVLLASCGAPPPAHVPVAPPGNHVDHDGPARDADDALRRWRALELTGANYEAKLADLELDDVERAKMARALLGAGGFTCNDVIEEDQCGEVYVELAPLDPAATFDSGCVRRVLALWSLQQLGPDDAAGLEPALIEMVSMRAPELALQEAAFALLDDEADQLRLRLMTAAEEWLAEAQVLALSDDDAVVHAATVLHLDAAVEHLARDPETHHAVLVGALGDDALLPETRAALINALANARDADTTAALIEVADGADDCALAQAAAEDLAARGEPGHLPVRPANHDPSAHLRALCMLQHATLGDRELRLRAWIGRDGLDEITEEHDDYHDPDVDPDPTNSSTTEPADVDVDALAERASRLGTVSGWTCSDDTLTCSLGDLTFTFAAAGHSLTLAMIEESYYSGCGC